MRHPRHGTNKLVHDVHGGLRFLLAGLPEPQILANYGPSLSKGSGATAHGLKDFGVEDWQFQPEDESRV